MPNTNQYSRAINRTVGVGRSPSGEYRNKKPLSGYSTGVKKSMNKSVPKESIDRNQRQLSLFLPEYLLQHLVHSRHGVFSDFALFLRDQYKQTVNGFLGSILF